LIPIAKISTPFQEYITLVHACIRLAIPFAPISCYSTPFEWKHALNLTKVTPIVVDEKFLTMVLPVAKERGIDLNHIYVMKGNAERRKASGASSGTLGRREIHLWVFELP
jgi:acyl-CoA synthetase (AMP-forming)/AMP-acid ligase II